MDFVLDNLSFKRWSKNCAQRTPFGRWLRFYFYSLVSFTFAFGIVEALEGEKQDVEVRLLLGFLA